MPRMIPTVDLYTPLMSRRSGLGEEGDIHCECLRIVQRVIILLEKLSNSCPRPH